MLNDRSSAAQAPKPHCKSVFPTNYQCLANKVAFTCQSSDAWFPTNCVLYACVSGNETQQQYSLDSNKAS